MQTATDAFPRFNHVALSVARDLLSPSGREELLGFYGQVFGWTEMPTMSEDGERLVLRCHSNEQFLFLQGSDEPLRAGPRDHFGVGVPTPEELDAMLERARKLREGDPRVEIQERQLEDFRVLKLHSFYVRFRLPLWVEVQCFEWAEGFDAQRTR